MPARHSAILLLPSLPVPSGVHLKLNVKADKVNLKSTNGDVSCPAITEGDIVTTNGAISVQNASGPLFITTSHGAISIENFSGNMLSATTENASIYCRVSSTALQSATLETTNGNISLSLSKQLPCLVELSTTNGNIDFDGVSPDDIIIGDNFFAGTSFRKETYVRNGSGGYITAQTTNSAIDVDLY